MTTRAAFRVPFWKAYLVINGATQFLGLMLIAPGWFLGPGGPNSLAVGLVAWAAGGLAAAFVTAPLVFLWVRVYAVRVSRNSLVSADVWGFPMTVPWGAVATAVPTRLFVAHYLKVSVRGSRRVMWLPLFLGRMDRFARFAERAAGPGHPLVRAVRDHGREPA